MFRRLFAITSLVLATIIVAPSEALASSSATSNVSYHRFVPPAGSLTIPSGNTARSWISPDFAPGFAFTELVASWNADTTATSLVEVDMQASPDGTYWTKWYVMGKWTYEDTAFHRTSVGGQGDKDGYVAIDTFVAGKVPMTSYRLQVTLTRASVTDASPTVRALGAMTSATPKKFAIPTPRSYTGAAALPSAVPQFSQEIHAGQFPEYDGGGEAWCSPTSTSMVLGYWGQYPSSTDMAYIPTGYTDPEVDYAARYTFDYHYNGTGNWPFNAAYAARFGMNAFVTRLRSLDEAEAFIRAGIPLVASIAVDPNKLDGFLFKSSSGHLLVITGITADGNVMANDPASTSDATVPHVYDRAHFEDAWLNHSGGIVYVIHPASVALPTAPAQANW
jgi:Peptidase_C39 like family